LQILIGQIVYNGSAEDKNRMQAKIVPATKNEAFQQCKLCFVRWIRL